ncbi:TPA: glycosyltransferase family 2 protein [Clostridium perfringens]
MKEIKFSVLIPVYNVQKFIVECIESVLNQTYGNFEIILIDDGSTDLSGTICEEFAKKDKRIKVYHQKNQGLIMSRRNAITKASGDYCLFLDSDDYWDSDLLEIINKTISTYDCDLIIYRFKRVSEDKNFIYDNKCVFNDKMVFESNNKEQLFKKIISSSDLNNLVCKAAKRSIIDEADYEEYKKIKNSEDLLQSLPLIYNAKKIVYLNNTMYNYRISTNSMTKTFNINLIKDITTVRGILLEYIKKLKFDDKENIKSFYQFYINSVLNYIIDLIKSDVSIEEKNKILDSIKNLQLYIDGLKYIDTSKLSFIHKTIFYLFNNRYYKTMIVYVNIIVFLKKIIKFIFLK